MILHNMNFLELLLMNPEVQRVSRMVAPKEGNDIFLFRASGVPERILLSLSERILSAFIGREHLLTDILLEDVSISLSDNRVKHFELDPDDSIEDPELLFPIGYNIALYRDAEKVNVTIWR